MPQSPYLTVDEAAQISGLTPRSIRRAVAEYRLPALRLLRRISIEAAALQAPMSAPVPPVLRDVDLAARWRVSTDTIHRLIARGALRAERSAAGWVISARAVARYEADWSTGPDEGVVLLRQAG